MREDLIERIRGANLTRAQQKIAEYLIQQPEKIGSMSSMDAAKEIGVSDASIIRFSRAIGFEGFSDLKAFIYQSLIDDSYASLSLSERMQQSTSQYADEEVPKQFLELMQSNLSNSFFNNKPELYDTAVEKISRADSCYVIGFRGVAGLSMSFSRLLSFMRSRVRSITDGTCVSISQVQDIQAGDVMVMFTYARYYKIDQTYLQMARDAGAYVILIVDNILSPLCSYADLVLTSETKHMSFFNSTVGTTMISEYLLSLLGRKLDFKERSDARDRLTEDERLPR